MLRAVGQIPIPNPQHPKPKMAYYPIAVDLTDQPVLVVGGGTVALRKIEMLIEFGARVTVVAPDVMPEIETLAGSGKIALKRRDYELRDIDDAILIIAATDDRGVNSRVSKDAQMANTLVNIVDDPELCSFIVPATIKRGDLTISISTAGKSPVLARRVREKIEEIFGPEYGELADLLGEIREIAKERFKEQSDRQEVFRKIVDSEVIDLLRTGKREGARSLALEILENSLNR